MYEKLLQKFVYFGGFPMYKKKFEKSYPVSRYVTKKCCTCGTLIHDLSDNMYKYTLTRVKRGKVITQYFCDDCLKRYHVKTIVW